jgi:hypothetical protein
MDARRTQRFEAGLEKLAAGLTRPHGIKNVDRLRERIGRLKERYAAGPRYRIDLQDDPERPGIAKALIWQRSARAGTRFTDPGLFAHQGSGLG